MFDLFVNFSFFVLFFFLLSLLAISSCCSYSFRAVWRANAKTQSDTITRQRTRQNWTEKIRYDWMERRELKQQQQQHLTVVDVSMCAYESVCVCVSRLFFFPRSFVRFVCATRYEFLPTTFEMICCTYEQHPNDVMKWEEDEKKKNKTLYKHIDKRYARPHKPMNEATMEYKHPTATHCLCIVYYLHSCTHTHTSPPIHSHVCIMWVSRRHYHRSFVQQQRVWSGDSMVNSIVAENVSPHVENASFAWSTLFHRRRRRIFPCPSIASPARRIFRGVCFVDSFNQRLVSARQYTHTHKHAELVLALPRYILNQSTKNKYDTFIIFSLLFHFFFLCSQFSQALLFFFLCFGVFFLLFFFDAVRFWFEWSSLLCGLICFGAKYRIK